MAWRAELIETLPDGTQRFRVVKTEPPKKHRRIIRDHEQTFMELYYQGLNDTEIGEELGFTSSAISTFRRQLRLPDNLRRVKKHTSRFMELYEKGLSDGDIGKALGFPRQSVGDFRRRHNLPANFKFGGKPGLNEEEKQRIRELHSQGLPINRIAKEIGRNNLTVVRFCERENLDHSRARGKGYINQRHGENLVSYLEEHGPTPQSTLSTDLKIPSGRFARMAREMFDQVERFKFKLGSSRGRGGIKFGGHSVYGDLNIQEMGNVFALRNDPRIVDFVAEGISFKVEKIQDARTLVLHLKKQLGSERARKVVKRLGYVYSKDRRGTHPKSKKKFTDKEFLDLYEKGMNDVEIAEELGVTPPTVGFRRRSMKLPVSKLGKLVLPLEMLDQIEKLEAEKR
jgi:DNA-binding NarL/FixJ family response regulator